MLLLVLILCEDGVAEVVLDCALSTVVFTAVVPSLILDFINNVVTAISPTRQITKATPKVMAEITAGLCSVPPKNARFKVNIYLT